MTEQLTLGFELREDTTFANFYSVNNNELLVVLQELARGRGEQFVYLWGNNSVGRTHLLQACCHVADKLKLSPFYLPLKNIDQLKPDVLEGLESLPLVCIDDIDCIVGRPAWEEAFFHFYNRIREEGKRLVIAGSKPANELGLALHDLVSRLNWGISFQMQELTDDEKLQALFLRAKARGLHVPENVAQYLLRHWPRDMASLFGALEKLDHASMVEKRKLTIPFVKEVL